MKWLEIFLGCTLTAFKTSIRVGFSFLNTQDCRTGLAAQPLLLRPQTPLRARAEPTARPGAPGEPGARPPHHQTRKQPRFYALQTRCGRKHPNARVSLGGAPWTQSVAGAAAATGTHFPPAALVKTEFVTGHAVSRDRWSPAHAAPGTRRAAGTGSPRCQRDLGTRAARLRPATPRRDRVAPEWASATSVRRRGGARVCPPLWPVYMVAPRWAAAGGWRCAPVLG